MEMMDSLWVEKSTSNSNSNSNSGSGPWVQLPDNSEGTMEFLSRSWSASALHISKVLAPPPLSIPSSLPPKLSSFPNSTNNSTNNNAIPEDQEIAGGYAEDSAVLSGNTFSFASSATSQLVLERIMSQSEISPLTSGRLSHSSGPLNGSLTEETESPPVSPSEEFEDVVKYLRANNTLQPLFTGGHNSCGGGSYGGNSTPGGKTVGRWLKERREKKKEETRAHTAQLHAAVSVAGVAAAVAAIAAATASASASRKDEKMAKTDMAMASAATLVAAQCVETAEAMGAERDHLTSAITSAVNVRSFGDVLTLTAAAATALRGAATFKARTLKEVWNISSVIPVDRALDCGVKKFCNNDHSHNEELVHGEHFLYVFNQELLARGSELLKRTRKGNLHWKIVSVYIHRTGPVMLKMKSKHVAGTITQKNKNVVLEVCKDMPAWPGRHLFEGGEQRRYFGLKTAMRGVIEFECKNQREYDMWTNGVSRLLSIVADRRNQRNRCQV